jgi:hypothetical protein
MLEKHLIRDDFPRRVKDRFASRSPSQGVQPARDQSYDHCYNYFADTDDLERDNMEKSCAVLGFYLASWGMYRGSTYLSQHTNSSHLQGVVRLAQRYRGALSGVDVDSYSDENVRRAILDVYDHIRRAVFPTGNEQKRSITIVTKIMMALFGCVPAFDNNFETGLRAVLHGHAKMPFSNVLTDKSLQLVAEFYNANRTVIDELHEESRTVAFGGDTVTDHKLTKAKILDMYCYDLGLELLEAARRRRATVTVHRSA